MLEFLTISLVIALGAISPGPDFVIVTRNALRYSQKTAVLTALGVSCSTLVHGTYCVLGLALVISNSLIIFSIIKYLGAGYLIYLGVSALFEKQTPTLVNDEKSSDNISALNAFLQGFINNLSNPKAIIFFLALFTMLIKPSMPIWQQAAYVIEIALVHAIWFSGVAIVLSHNRVKVFLGRSLHLIAKTFGGVLVLFGLKIAMLSQR